MEPTMQGLSRNHLEDVEEGDADHSRTTLDLLDDPDEKEEVVIATAETQRVCYLRVILLCVLLVVAACVSFATYWSTYSNQQDKFEAYAVEACQKVATSFQSSATQRLGAIDSLALSISSGAAAQGLTWPNVTVPDFEERVSKTLDLAAVMSITMIPVVTGEHLDGWNAYSNENQGWLQEGLDIQAAAGFNLTEDKPLLDQVVGPDYAMSTTISPNVYYLAATIGAFNRAANSTTDVGPFLPWWQFAPAFGAFALVNYDTLSHPTRRPLLQGVLENQEALVSKAWDYADNDDPSVLGKKAVLRLYLQKGWKRSYQDGPASDLYFPIFDRSPGNKNEQKVAAILTAYIYWQVYFEEVLPPKTEPVVAVLENICGNVEEKQMFTYRIEGETAVYIGSGDLHDPQFDYLEATTGYPAFLANKKDPEDLKDGQCMYNVRVYPSAEMKDAFYTNEPLYFLLIILATFAITSLIFLFYDYTVERRQKIVLTKAIKSTKVVQEMFPENVRDRLFDESDGQTSSRQGKGNPLRENTGADSTALSNGSFDTGASTIVADLYENCTVFFADISGFTEWASQREPAHVFLLLETLYGGFDKVAKRRGVFKVETIGDCYLAITGVPRPRKDHAVIMAKFASECIECMSSLIHNELIGSLGDETKDLKLRIGLHSGSVTAGVLRGDRARFQLFGDTVNTASRMESTGIPGKIQASEETSQLLREAKKEAWLTPREGGIEAKGKGRLSTNWVHPTRHAASTMSQSNDTMSNADTMSNGTLSNDTSGKIF